MKPIKAILAILAILIFLFNPQFLFGDDLKHLVPKMNLEFLRSLFLLKKEAVIKALPGEFTKIRDKTDIQSEMYKAVDWGLTISFENDSITVLSCDERYDILGAHGKMKIQEIQEIFWKQKIDFVQTNINMPDPFKKRYLIEFNDDLIWVTFFSPDLSKPTNLNIQNKKWKFKYYE